MRRHGFYDIEIVFGLPATGRFVAEDGSLSEFDLPDGTTIEVGAHGRVEEMADPQRRAVAQLVADEIARTEWAIIGQTRETETMREYAPAVI